jgi:hypothetical protein
MWKGFQAWQQAAAATQTTVYAIGDSLYW